jgi:hypothetical protein
MKFGAVRDVNSLSALMIARDDHDGALSAAPKPRHHLQAFFRKILKYQCDNERRGMIHNHPSFWDCHASGGMTWICRCETKKAALGGSGRLPGRYWLSLPGAVFV